MMRRLKYYLYLLQLENYDVVRYVRAVQKDMAHIPSVLRKDLVWTFKMRVLCALVCICFVFWIWGIWAMTGGYPTLMRLGSIAFGAWMFYAFSFVCFAALTSMVFPIDWFAKAVYMHRARMKLRTMKRITIIGITGSYGKTTMKEMLATVLKKKYRVVATKENMNTPLGLSRSIVRDVHDDTDILIVEMGAYQEGDIRLLCFIATPDISIVTGINESHLERFKTLETTTRAKFEIVRYASPHALVVLNSDNDRIRGAHASYTTGHAIIFYGTNDSACPMYRVVLSRFSQDSLSMECIIRHPSGKDETYRVSVCAPYIASTVAGCLAVATHLGLSEQEFRFGLAMAKPVPHRLQPMRTANGGLIIDDSYNGNPEGARHAMAFLKAWTGGKRIYVTPGLVELGSAMQEIHERLGKELATSADSVVLIKSPGAFALRKGLEAAGFPKKQIRWFENAQDAHTAVLRMIQNNDCAVFQNDVPENYL